MTKQQLPLGFDDEPEGPEEPEPRTGDPAASGVGPAGGDGDRVSTSRVRDPFVAQLAELCCAHPTRAKWVVVPTHAVGNTLGDRLAREGTSWANLRFVTPLDLATRIAGPFLVERGIDPSEEPLGPALMMRLLSDLENVPKMGTGTVSEMGTRSVSSASGPETVRVPIFAASVGYFAPLAAHTTLAVALWNALRESRYAGLWATDLPRDAFASADKHAELGALFDAYARVLETNRVADLPLVFDEALRQLSGVPPLAQGVSPASRDGEPMADGRGSTAAYCPIAPTDLVLELPDVAWPPIVRRFLDALPGQRVTPRALLVPGLDPSPRFCALAAPADRVGPVPFPGASAESAVSPIAKSDSARLRFLRVPDQAGPVRDDGTLDLFHAGGRDAEIEEVCRRIFASGRPLDAAEIACATPDHALLAWEKARRLDWPVTIGTGLPAAMTRPGRALLDWCAWIEGGFAASDLRHMLQSGDLAPGPFADEPRLSASQAARLLLRAETTWGRDTYARTLSAYIAREESRAREEDGAGAAWRRQRAAQAQRLLAWVSALLAAIPEPGSQGTVALPQVLDAASGFLEQNVARASDFDAAAYLVLADAVSGLRALGRAHIPLALGLRFLTDAVESLNVGRGRPRPGHLHVSALADAGADARPLVFIVGLEEARVFGTAVEDPVLLDTERRAIGCARGDEHLLRTASDRLDEAVYAIVLKIATLGCTSERITLSFSAVDTRDSRETFPSWLILQAYRLKEGEATLGYGALRAWLREPASAVPADADRALTDDRWWLAAARKGDVQHPAEAFPSIAHGARAARERASDALTAFDGLVPEAGQLLDPTRNGRAISPTTLEDAAKCPFRFFLKSGLGIEAVDERERDADVWLDPLTRGAELHDLYAALTRRARNASRRVTRTDDLAWFLERGRARLETLRSEIPPPSEEVFVAEKAEFEEDLAAFIEAEEELRGVEPLAFEVGFGRPPGDEDEPLAREEPVEIRVDRRRTLRVAGRIDRIERGKAHEYHVVDYKTGRYWRDDYGGTFVGGALLQHALYGRAAEALLAEIDRKARVTQGIYWFPTGRGWGKRVVIDAPTDDALAAVMGDLTAVIGDGAFTQTPDKDECRWCDFSAACGREPWNGAARKVAADVDGRLAAWRRLKERR